jgi:heme/copper-type cytochrome/quinol oxidase subunit 2
VNYCGVGHTQMKAWLVVEGGENTASLEMNGGNG